MKKLVFLFCAIMLSACWRMPEEGEVSTIPATNNPSVTKQDTKPWTPGSGSF